jgi:hypothetical protein
MNDVERGEMAGDRQQVEDGSCPRICLAVMVGSLLAYFPFEHLLPDCMHRLAGFVLLCSTVVFLAWCCAGCVVGRRPRA